MCTLIALSNQNHVNYALRGKIGAEIYQGRVPKRSGLSWVIGTVGTHVCVYMGLSHILKYLAQYLLKGGGGSEKKQLRKIDVLQYW